MSIPPRDPLASARALADDREFAFTPTDFERIRRLIYQRAGIALAAHKQDMVYSRLARRLRAHGDKRFAEYVARLETGDAGEWEHFINALTTNLTSFFRESHHFDLLAEQLGRIAEPRPLRVWCCAASTGEEPYSIAIAAMEALGSRTPMVSVLASDVDTGVLRHASAGRYASERMQGVSAARLERHFVPMAGEGGNAYCVRPELRRLVEFRRVNLLEPLWPVSPGLDAIFCRNVMIYFDKPTQYRILKRFAPLLRPDGRLYAGHSESFPHAADLFRSLGRTVYARVDARI